MPKAVGDRSRVHDTYCLVMTPNKDIVHDHFLVKALMFEELGGDEMIQRLKNHDRTPNITLMLHYEEIESE
jgi:hypothetical protein